jgi:PST family polysaccharide transporter
MIQDEPVTPFSFPSLTRLRRAGARRVLSNLSWLLVDRVVRMGANLIVSTWVARYLKPAQFGNLSFAVAIVALLASPASLGLDQLVVRELVADPENKNELMGTSFAMKFLAGCVFGLLLPLGFYLFKFNTASNRLLVVICGASLIFSGIEVIDFWFQSKVKSVFSVWARSLAFFVTAIARIILIVYRASLVWFAVIPSLEAIVSTIVLLIAYRKDGESIRHWRVNWHRGLALLAISWPQILSMLAVLVYLRIDVVMLQSMASSEAVGLYAAATRLSEVWYYMPTAVSSSVLPALIAARKNNYPLYRVRAQRVMDFMSVTSISIALVVTFLSTRLIVLMYGRDYAAAGPILAIHVWSGVFAFMNIGSLLWVTAEGLYGRLFWANATGAVVNIVLNLWLIPRYGAMGSAIATLVSYMIACYACTPIFFRGHELFAIQTRSLFTPFWSYFHPSPVQA